MEPRAVLIGNRASEQLRIELEGPAGHGWQTALVELECEIWRGRFRWSFMNGELREFARGLETLWRNLTGTVELHPVEPNLLLKVVGDGKGHMVLEGRASGSNCYFGTYLVFTIALDQTELPAILVALRALDSEAA